MYVELKIYFEYPVFEFWRQIVYSKRNVLTLGEGTKATIIKLYLTLFYMVIIKKS